MSRLNKYSTLRKRVESLEEASESEAAEQGLRDEIVFSCCGKVLLPSGQEVPEEEYYRRCEEEGVEVVKVSDELDAVDYEGL